MMIVNVNDVIIDLLMENLRNEVRRDSLNFVRWWVTARENWGRGWV